MLEFIVLVSFVTEFVVEESDELFSKEVEKPQDVKMTLVMSEANISKREVFFLTIYLF